MSLERTYKSLERKSLERNCVGVDRHEFLLLTAADTLNPSIFSPFRVLRGRCAILIIWP
jgi:hypothetical protein